MKKSKKIISLLLSLIMILSVFNIVPFTVGAAEADTAETGCTWTLDDNGVLTISGNGKMGDYDYTDKNGSYVTTAPWGGYSFNTVVIESGVTSIGTYAFYGCTGLTSVTIGNSVTSIGWGAFSGCTGLTSVDIPGSVTSIGEYAFSGCTGLTSVDIPDSVTSIGDSAFSGCWSLTSVTIPDSVTSISVEAFFNCTGLTSVTIPDSVTSIGERALGYYYDNGYKKISGFKIYGYKDTEAEKYAKNNGFTFKAIIGKCDKCNSTLFEYDYHSGYPATCVKDGLSDGYICPSCGHKSQTVIPATGHTPGEPVQENLFKSTCTKEGSYDEVTYCTVCKAELSRETKTIDMLPHTPVTGKAVPATCIKTGLTEGSHCSVCKTVLVEQTVIPALGHKPIIDKAVEATCQHDGHTIGSYCENCGEVYVQSQVIPKLPHTPVKDEAVAATCTHTGLTEGYHCSECDEVLVAQKVTAALGHSYEVVPITPATFFHPGLTEGVRCSRCGEWLIEQQETPKLIGEGIFGDIDSDEAVDVRDATWIQRLVAGIDIPFTVADMYADIDGDGEVNVMDATAIQYYLIKSKNPYKIGQSIA